MALLTATQFGYVLAAVLAAIALVVSARVVRLWQSLRKLDRRQRISPTATAVTWTVTILAFMPVYYLHREVAWTVAIFGAVFVVGMQAVGIYLSNRDWAIAHAALPKRDARMVSYEPLIVSGEVMVPDDEADVGTIAGPVSGEPCVAYLGDANETLWLSSSSTPGMRRTSRTLALDSGGTPFYLDDGTGRVLIDPATADILPSSPASPSLGASHSSSETIEAGNVAPDHLQRYERELGISSSQRRKRSYNEYRIEPGDEVYVIGTAEGVTGTEYPSRATHVVTDSGDVPNVIVGEPYESVDSSFSRFRTYYFYGGLAATVLGYAGMLAAAAVL